MTGWVWGVGIVLVLAAIVLGLVILLGLALLLVKLGVFGYFLATKPDERGESESYSLDESHEVRSDGDHSPGGT